MRTVYTIAFSEDRFLMVYNPKRNGWEMPGGKAEDNEKDYEAAIREYREESGYNIKIIDSQELNGCRVFAALLGSKLRNGEMRTELFTELPDELAFDRSEYDNVMEWARSVMDKKVKG